MHEKISIYGISYNNVTLDEAAALAEKMLEEESNHMAVTPNAEIAYMATHDVGLGRIINSPNMTATLPRLCACTSAANSVIPHTR